MLQAGFWLLAMLGFWLWARRLRRRSALASRADFVEQALPLRGRWLRYLLLGLIGVALLLALGGCIEGFIDWTEAYRYRPR